MQIPLHAAAHTHHAKPIERHERDIEPGDPEPETAPAPDVVQAEPDCLRKPEVEPRQHAEERAGYEHVVEVGDQEHGVVDREIDGRNGQQYPGDAADDEGHQEADGVEHRSIEAQAAAVHGEEPVIDLHARRHRDDHGHDAEKCIDAGARTHGEEMMQPDGEAQHADRHGGINERDVAEQLFLREGGDDLGKNTERRQDQNVDFRMAPQPEEIDELHHVAAVGPGEKVETECPVQP